MARVLRVVGAIGAVTRLWSLAFLVPALVAFFYDTYDLHWGPFALPHGVLIFTACAALTYLLGWAMVLLAARSDRGTLRDREAYLTAGLGWLVLCLLSMLPFIMNGVLRNPVDAFFETMSGMTTTGATVLTGDWDAIPKSLMVWRAALQFVGGMGIIVLSVAMLARLTQGGTQLLQAEAPGPSVQRIAPRVGHTARLLWTVYAAMAAVLFVVIMAVLARHHLGLKQTIYEAIILTLTTISTGGFAAHPESIAYFHDGLLELVLIVFMLLSGMNYTLHYRALRGSPRAMWRDPEWRFYMGTFLVVTLAVTGLLVHAGQSLLGGLRGGAFTVASLITSTGFGTADFDLWPATTKFLLLMVMVTGATAGSTGGGIKHVRVLLMFKLIGQRIKTILHPRAVVPVKLGLRTIRGPTLMTAAAFLVTFVGVWMISAFLLMQFDPALANPVDATSASVSALSNMGPGFGAVGPTKDYAGLTLFSKLVLAFEMWFGRLEIFAALLIFTPETWK